VDIDGVFVCADFWEVIEVIGDLDAHYLGWFNVVQYLLIDVAMRNQFVGGAAVAQDV
jgi:hypothetical protein